MILRYYRSTKSNVTSPARADQNTRRKMLNTHLCGIRLSCPIVDITAKILLYADLPSVVFLTQFFVVGKAPPTFLPAGPPRPLLRESGQPCARLTRMRLLNAVVGTAGPSRCGACGTGAAGLGWAGWGSGPAAAPAARKRPVLRSPDSYVLAECRRGDGGSI